MLMIEYLQVLASYLYCDGSSNSVVVYRPSFNPATMESTIVCDKLLVTLEESTKNTTKRLQKQYLNKSLPHNLDILVV